ncbi:MAG TPA: thiamine pyrophosphate-dependent enzyme, partial [Nannocystis sp.]
LLPHLKARAPGSTASTASTASSWRTQIEAGVAEWRETVRARAMQDANPLNPQRVVWELSARLPDRCIVTADSGTSAVWFARDLQLRRGMLASVSGTLATMGCGVPYALAAKLAFPDRPVVALVGDGAMQMNGNSELITLARHWQAWKDPRLVVVVLNNRDLNFVTWEMRLMGGSPRWPASQQVPDFPYARYAELLGLRGIRVDAPDQVGPAWDQALASDRPVVLEAFVDPDVPVLPPLFTRAQEKTLRGSLADDAEASGVRRQLERELEPGGVRRRE